MTNLCCENAVGSGDKRDMIDGVALLKGETNRPRLSRDPENSLSMASEQKMKKLVKKTIYQTWLPCLSPWFKKLE
ncbi:UNVERIFIED_CONTAM: hypothetical protein ACS92_02120 [Bacillus cereus]